MSQIPFVKMHGLGNCYIYVDLISQKLELPDLPELARKVSNPFTGIGSDGLILMVPSDVADLKMRIFNKDGSEGKNLVTDCAVSPNTPMNEALFPRKNSISKRLAASSRPKCTSPETQWTKSPWIWGSRI